MHDTRTHSGALNQILSSSFNTRKAFIPLPYRWWNGCVVDLLKANNSIYHILEVPIALKPLHEGQNKVFGFIHESRRSPVRP